MDKDIDNVLTIFSSVLCRSEIMKLCQIVMLFLCVSPDTADFEQTLSWVGLIEIPNVCCYPGLGSGFRCVHC